MPRHQQKHQPRPQQQHRISQPRSYTVHSKDYWLKKEQFLAELNALYDKRERSWGAKRKELEAELNEKVISWNVDYLKKETLLDLHGMTPEAALLFVTRQVARKSDHGDFELITGKGLHSKDNKARIKAQLMKEFKGRPRCRIEEKEGNSGRLLLSLW